LEVIPFIASCLELYPLVNLSFHQHYNVESKIQHHYDSHREITCFTVSAKSYNVETRRSEARRAKTARNSHRSKASNAVVVTQRRAVMGEGGDGKCFSSLEACDLVIVAVIPVRAIDHNHEPAPFTTQPHAPFL
jgi:hypothetical protein